ncbi:MAG TPA: ABC transporter permease [Meiothermus sp.]|nr:ABC transporter permease [Meiothermus sp.]
MNPARDVPQTHPAKPRSSLAGMNPLQVVSIAWRAILGNPLRSILTALGVIIGVAAVIALTGVGQGSTANITRSLESLGTNLLTVSSGSGFRGGPPGLVRGGPGQTITLKDAQAIQTQFASQIAGLAPVAQGGQQVKFGANNMNATIIGTWPAYASVRNAQPEKGSFFTEADNQGRKRVAVIGYQVAQDLFEGTDPIGQKIRIAGISFTVVGVLPDKGNSGFASPNSQILIPLSTYQQRLGRSNNRGEPTVSQVYVQGLDKNSLKDLQNAITDLMATRHKKTSPDDYDFNVQNQADALASVNQVTQTLTLFLGGVAGISLLVGGIGIMNIMLVSVTERTREIGIRKALGAKPRDILTQFLVESVVLSVGGGVLGILAGLGLARGVGNLLSITPVFSPSSILVAFLFSAVVGIFFGFYPASRAARLDPVESLRYE